LAKAVQEQVKTAISDADVIIFLCDVKDGVTPFDREIANMLRRTKKPILLVTNKADNLKLEAHATEFYELGLGDPLTISAYHGQGTADLLDKIISLLPVPETPSGPAE
jgi:GTP-binding protein